MKVLLLSNMPITNMIIMMVMMMMMMMTIMMTTEMKMNVMTFQGLEKLMSTSRNWGELVWAWEEWRNVSGKNMRSSYIKMVSLLNKQVKLKGKYGS